MKVLNLYIAKQALKGIAVAFIIVIALIMLIDFVESTRTLGADANLNAGQVLMMTALKTPQLIEQTVPFVVLFGLMGALYGMNRRSELIVMRASGLSAWRFLRPAMIPVIAIGVLWSLAVNPLATMAMGNYENLKDKYLGDAGTVSEQSIWLREGTEFEQTVIYAPRFNMIERTLYEAEFTVFEPDELGDLVFARRFDAKEAKLLPGGYWQLSDVLENTTNGRQQINQAVALPTTIKPKNLQESQTGAGLSPVWALPGEIRALKQAGFSSKEPEIRLHKLLSLPLTLLAMSVIAAAVSMRLTREGGTLRFMLSGAVVGFGVFFIENMIRAFGEAGAVPVKTAVWVIPALVLVCGMAYLSRIEDG